MTVEEMIAERTVKVTAALDEANDTISLKGGTPSADLHGLSAAIASIPQGGGGESHTVELTSDGGTIAAATNVFAVDVPQTGTYAYILTSSSSVHPFYPTSGARFVMAIFVDGSLKGNVGYRSVSSGVISGFAPTVAANSYAGDKYTRLEVV